MELYNYLANQIWKKLLAMRSSHLRSIHKHDSETKQKYTFKDSETCL